MNDDCNSCSSSFFFLSFSYNNANNEELEIWFCTKFIIHTKLLTLIVTIISVGNFYIMFLTGSMLAIFTRKTRMHPTTAIKIPAKYVVNIAEPP